MRIPCISATLQLCQGTPSPGARTCVATPAGGALNGITSSTSIPWTLQLWLATAQPAAGPVMFQFGVLKPSWQQISHMARLNKLGRLQHSRIRTKLKAHMGGCQNYGPLLGPLNTRCRIILRTQKGTMISQTTHVPNSRHIWVAVTKDPKKDHNFDNHKGTIILTTTKEP